MARFCLDAALIGTEKHLVVDESGFWWGQHVPKDTWHLDGNVKPKSLWCLDTVLRLANRAPNVLPPDPFVRQMSILSGSLRGSSVPWKRVMPGRAHLGFVRSLVEQITVAMDGAPLDYYRTVWTVGDSVIGSLKPCFVDRPRWEELIESGEGNVPAVKSFEPGPDGFARPVTYDRFRTLTGRLTVDSGPQILTLKRGHRNVLRSLYGKDGAVYALDFAALEARVLLYEYNRMCDDVDLYDKLASELGYDRTAIKGAVIAKLYGMNDWALAKTLGIEGKEFNSFLERFNVYFNTNDLLVRVKSQFVATGKVINRYGRPIIVDEPQDNIFVSYYGQSTGVDVTMLGFRQVIDTMVRKAPRARPILLLHDSILFDLPKDDVQHLQVIKSVRVNGYVQKYFLKMEKIS